MAGRNEFKISQKILAEVIQPRIKEIFELSKEEIQKADFNGDYTFGIVLTGGCSKLDGIVKTAFDVFNMPIKKGEPVIYQSASKVVKKVPSVKMPKISQ